MLKKTYLVSRLRFNQFIAIFENRIQLTKLNPEVFYLHKIMDSAFSNSIRYGKCKQLHQILIASALNLLLPRMNRGR